MTEEELQQQEQEQAEALAEWQSVFSSMVSEVNWEEGQLGVRFNSGSEDYYPATQKQFEELLTAASIGRWMWDNYGEELHRGRTGE